MAKGALLCDAWTGTYASSRGEHYRRHMFYTAHNIIPPALMPGGWSSHGQPVDAMHASFRKAVRALDLSSIGCEANLRKRPRSQTAVSQ